MVQGALGPKNPNADVSRMPRRSRLARAAGRTPLGGRIIVGEVRGQIAAAFWRDENRAIEDAALAPTYLATLLRLRAEGIAAFEREPDLAVRVAEALRGPRREEQLPLAA